MADSVAPPDGESSQQKFSSMRLAVYEVSGDVRKVLARLELSAKLDETPLVPVGLPYQRGS